MTDQDAPAYLDPSALGTKQYWDNCYALELQNHNLNPTDEGTIWFSDSGAEEKLLSYLLTLDLSATTSASDPDDNADAEDVRILDLGTGNGHLLFALREEGWRANMVGVDYSETSVGFARRIWQGRRKEEREALQQEEEEADEEARDDDEATRVSVLGSSGTEEEEARENDKITFHAFDILLTPPSPASTPWLGSGFDIVLDKGTFDAISLSSETDASGRRAFETYGAKVEPLMKVGGYFVIVSCNWTEEEVRKWFESPTLVWHERVKFPSFRFGGKEGSTVCCVCFKRVREGKDGRGS